MAEFPVLTEQSGMALFFIAIVVVALLIFLLLNPQIVSTTGTALCNSFYDILYFFIGPRPPIELCGSTSAAEISSVPK